MKKIVCVSLALLALLGCLTACTFTRSASGPLAGTAQSADKVEEMMAALAEERVTDAKALMHPEVAEQSEDAIAQICDFLAGRSATEIVMEGISVNTSSGTAGKSRQELVTYRVQLSDGDVVYLNVGYLSNGDGDGFNSFRLVLGVM